MPLPPLQLRPISTSHYYISGDVTIYEGAAIAPGVLLQADPNSRVIIQAGACIGVGSILHAHNGTVEIEQGASVGAEVLLIGNVTIGAGACIGSATTILNDSIKQGQVIPPGSLIGEANPPVQELQATDTVYSTVVPEVEMSPTGVDRSEPAASGTGVNVYGQVYVNQMLVKMFPNRQADNSSANTQSKPILPEDPWDD